MNPTPEQVIEDAVLDAFELDDPSERRAALRKIENDRNSLRIQHGYDRQDDKVGDRK